MALVGWIVCLPCSVPQRLRFEVTHRFTPDLLSVAVTCSCPGVTLRTNKCVCLYHASQLFLSIITYLLTPYSRVLLEKLTDSELVKKLPTFYWTRMFITAFTSARHMSLSWASPIQSTTPHRSSWRSILILSSHLRLCLPIGLFPSGFSTKIFYTSLLSPIRATCPPISFFLI